MTNFKILITDEGPVVIDAPVKPVPCENRCKQPQDHPAQMCECAFEIKMYEQALASIIADKSKRIQFLFGDRITIDQFYDYKLKHGDIVDIPNGYQLEFKPPLNFPKTGMSQLAVLVPIKEKPSEPENSAQEQKEIKLGEIFTVEGKPYVFTKPETSSQKATTTHGHILHEINYL